MRVDYQTVTDSLIAQIEAGALPWLKPWQNLGAGMSADIPINPATPTTYSGVNVFILWGSAMANGYPTGRWLTVKQIMAAGGYVKDGHDGKGTAVFFMKPMAKKELNAKGDEIEKRFALMRSYEVFNVAQCEGLPELLTQGKALPPAPELDSMFKSFVAATGANIAHGGDRACYIPAIDAIHMPPIQAFDNTDSYKATLTHELSHWSGHESRLNRSFKGRFGDSSYAFEELIAEISSAFLCAHLGVKAELRHAGYLANWLKILKDDPRAIFTAASQASKAADHLRAYSELSGAEGDDEIESIAA